MAYRGRVLVELETKLNAKCGSETELISQTDIVKVQVSLDGFLTKYTVANL